MTRIPDFYDRRFAPVGEQPFVAADVDELKCRECGTETVHDHADLPPEGELVPCPECNLPSRVPALPSQAGMAEPIDPPLTSERS